MYPNYNAGFHQQPGVSFQPQGCPPTYVPNAGFQQNQASHYPPPVNAQHYGAAQTAYPVSAPGYPSTGTPGYPSYHDHGPAHQPQCPPVNPSFAAPNGTAYPYTEPPLSTGCPLQFTAPQQQPFHETPSIKAVHFDPVADAQALRVAMKGFGTNESTIISVLSRRTDPQRQQIAQAFKTSFGRDLVKDFKSELSGHLEDVVVALMTPRVELLAKRLNKAMKGIGTNEKALIDVLCTASNQEIRQINAVYSQLFKKSLESELSGDTSGYFQKLLVSLNSAGRSDDPYANPALAMQDAQQLYKAGEKRMGTDESMFIMILGTRSLANIRLMLHEYQRISGNSLETAIRKEFSGDIQMGLLAVVKCAKNRAAYFAKRLHESMAGMGTDDEDLIFIIVTRAEIDMENVKREYAKKYHKPLSHDISGDTSGHYKKMLLALIGA